MTLSTKEENKYKELREYKRDKEEQPSLLAAIPTVTAIVSAIAMLSTVILAWRTDRRNAREQELKIAKLIHEIEEIKNKDKE